MSFAHPWHHQKSYSSFESLHFHSNVLSTEEYLIKEVGVNPAVAKRKKLSLPLDLLPRRNFTVGFSHLGLECHNLIQDLHKPIEGYPT